MKYRFRKARIRKVPGTDDPESSTDDVAVMHSQSK